MLGVLVAAVGAVIMREGMGLYDDGGKVGFGLIALGVGGVIIQVATIATGVRLGMRK